MIELDYFKSKLIGYLKEHTSERIGNGEWIDIVSDTAYDDMNHFIQGGLRGVMRRKRLFHRCYQKFRNLCMNELMLFTRPVLIRP